MDVNSGNISVNNDVNINGGWLRVKGDNGIFFQDRGGGWHMKDDGWIRSFGGKNVYCDSGIRSRDMSTEKQMEVGTSLKVGTTLTVNNGLGMMFFSMEVGDDSVTLIEYGGQKFDTTSWVCIVAGINTDMSNERVGAFRCYTIPTDNYWKLRSGTQDSKDCARVPILAIPTGYFKNIDTSIITRGDIWL